MNILGNIEMLEKYRVVTGGDQLTKVRFKGAINLRLLSVTPTGRLEHVQPVVCELWHMKQDYLEVSVIPKQNYSHC